MILKPTEPLPVEKKPSKIIGGMPDGIGVGKKVLERNTYKGIRSNQGIQGGPLQKDPAIIAMESAGLQTTGRELVPIKEYAKKDPKELEERPSEVAKKTFEAHGLNFVYVATKIHEIMDGGEPKTQLQALHGEQDSLEDRRRGRRDEKAHRSGQNSFRGHKYHLPLLTRCEKQPGYLNS